VQVVPATVERRVGGVAVPPQKPLLRRVGGSDFAGERSPNDRPIWSIVNPCKRNIGAPARDCR
jgi:hypothetical protein